LNHGEIFRIQVVYGTLVSVFVINNIDELNLFVSLPYNEEFGDIVQINLVDLEDDSVSLPEKLIRSFNIPLTSFTNNFNDQALVDVSIRFDDSKNDPCIKPQ
jgi:hypothetical protein